MSTKPETTQRKKLNFMDCMGMATGQIIGSGIMVLTGIVIGLTGHGTPYAFIFGGHRHRRPLHHSHLVHPRLRRRLHLHQAPHGG